VNKNVNNFVVQVIEHYNDRGGDGGMATTIVGVVKTLEAGMQMLDDMGAKEGRVLQIFPPMVREDGRLVPGPPDVFPYCAPPQKKARGKKIAADVAETAE